MVMVVDEVDALEGACSHQIVDKLLDSIVQFEDQLGGDSSGEDETFLVTDPEAYRSRKSSEGNPFMW